MSRRVLVTGAASGLGAALVEQFAANGDQVLATDRVVPEGVHALRLDITLAEDWAVALDYVRTIWGGLDVLVNNAGVAGGGRVDVATVEEWRWIFDVNLFGMVRGMRTFVPLFKEQRAGHVVNIASLAGLVHPAGMASYNAVKAAVVALTETADHELHPYGVRATAVCPSFFRTNLMDSMKGTDAALADVMRRFVEQAPTSAEEIAAEVVAAVDGDERLVLPDDAARATYELKRSDPDRYTEVMREGGASLAGLPVPGVPVERAEDQG